MPKMLIEGYASLFDIEDLDGDITKKGCFEWALKRYAPDEIRFLLHHENREPIGSWCEFFEDDIGLFCRGEIDIHKIAGNYVIEQHLKGKLNGLSIGFRALDFRSITPGKRGRILTKVDLREVSAVANPMLLKARFKKV